MVDEVLYTSSLFILCCEMCLYVCVCVFMTVHLIPTIKRCLVTIFVYSALSPADAGERRSVNVRIIIIIIIIVTVI